MPRFCPVCGESISSGDFCREHSPEGKVEIKDIKLKICARCNKYLDKGTWKPFQRIEVLVKRMLADKLGRKIMVSVITHHTGIREAKVIKDKKEIIIPLHIESGCCDECSLQGTRYFQGVLQVRNASKQYIQKLREFFKREERKHRFITREEHKGSSIDLYVSSNKSLDVMSRELKKLGAVIIKSSRLFSRDSLTSKELYRGTVLAVFPSIKKGDYIKLDNQPVKVVSVSRHWKGVNLATGKTIIIKPTDKFEILEKNKTRISSVKPEVMVLDPETYQETILYNPPKDAAVSKSVTIIKVNGRLYCV